MGFLTGLILGIVTGMAIGALLTPRSGEENRAALRENLPPKAAETLDRALGEARSRLEQGKQAFSTGAEEAREQLNEELQREREGK
jgi:gas vesicle protein